LCDGTQALFAEVAFVTAKESTTSIRATRKKNRKECDAYIAPGFLASSKIGLACGQSTSKKGVIAFTDQRYRKQLVAPLRKFLCLVSLGWRISRHFNQK
jgi:hypothetical protein